MPNASNIESPLIIIGAGRAGTSWLQVILRNHPQTQRVIDNTLLGSIYRDAYDSWWSPALLKSVGDDPARREELVIRTIRQTLCTMFPGDEPFWATKAIWDWTKQSFGAVPNQFRLNLFPKARYLHLTRDPRTAMPSILEYFQNRGLLDTIERCEDAYVDAHKDAFRMRDAGVPYLLVPQEDIRSNPVETWALIEKFAGLDSHPLPEELLRREINQSASQTGKVREGRAPLQWSDLRATTHEIARALGYEIPEDVEPKPPGVATPTQKNEEQTTVEHMASENYLLRTEVRNLRAELEQVQAQLVEASARAAKPSGFLRTLKSRLGI